MESLHVGQIYLINLGDETKYSFSPLHRRCTTVSFSTTGNVGGFGSVDGAVCPLFTKVNVKQ